jgi:hypothetical protein
LSRAILSISRPFLTVDELHRQGVVVLFHITQVHTPETCPRDEGGSNSLFNPNVPGLKLIGRYGANSQHTMFFIVEASDVNAIQKFLWPDSGAVLRPSHR